MTSLSLKSQLKVLCQPGAVQGAGMQMRNADFLITRLLSYEFYLKVGYEF